MTADVGFREDVSVVHEGITYTLTLAEQRACETPGNYWHGKGDPSSWLTSSVVSAAKTKCTGAPDAVAFELAALAFGIPVAEVERIVAWNDAYMRWHDGEPPDPNVK